MAASTACRAGARVVPPIEGPEHDGLHPRPRRLSGETTLRLLRSMPFWPLAATLAARVLDLGYGAASPASTHLLVPQTPRPVFNLVMSLRQIGMPLGGVLAALILPPLALTIGWRGALLMELGPVLLLIGLMEIPRRRWDHDREPGRRILGRGLLQPFVLLAEPRFQ